MKRTQLIEIINQTALNVWQDCGMVLQVYEETRGHWVVQLNTAKQMGIPTEHVLYVANAMIATALNYKPITLKAENKAQALENAIFEAELYERAGKERPEDTPTRQTYERMKDKETA